MLFNSLGFVVAFAPLTLAVTALLTRWRPTAGRLALVVFSLAFYAFGDLRGLPILLASFAFNFVVGRLIVAFRDRHPSLANATLAVGVGVDVAVLLYFKYAKFLLSVAHVHGPVWDLVAHLTPPLAVSFYTFVEIAYLVDTSRGETRKLGPIDFSLFMAFFPKLISGPIVRFHEMAPQLETRRAGRVLSRDLMIGLVLFSIGLFKKTAFADTLAPYTAQLFTDAHQHPLPAAYAWLAATLFTFQLYFDFSGYSDMAIGIARMFDIKLPLNFHSPLRAASIIDFWRRWHMTLQRWVVSYIFQPMSLPINRMAASVGLGGWSAFLVATAFPIFITFVVLGVWHGAGWTFAVFGVMHGVYLAINEAWREHQKRVRRRRRRAGLPLTDPGAVTRATYHGLTLGAVLLANIAFRSPDLGESWSLWRSMAGAPLSHAVTPAPPSWTVVSVLLACAFTVFCLPNSQQIMGRFQPALNWEEWKAVGIPPIRWSWKPSLAGLVFAGLTLFVGVMLTQRGPAIFVYYNF